MIDRLSVRVVVGVGRSLGSPCISFDAGANGVCKRDGRVCDLLTEKGERYMREYE